MILLAAQHAEQNKEIQKIRDETKTELVFLEKWRHVLIGASIVAGFVLNKFIEVS